MTRRASESARHNRKCIREIDQKTSLLINLTHMITLSALHIYPIKACRGHAGQEAFVERRGLAHDRRLLIIDAQGIAVTQRDNARLALVLPELDGESLGLSAPGMPVLNLPLTETGPMRSVTVWDDSGIQAVDQGEEVAGWFSTYLKDPVRLVRMTKNSIRPVSPKYAQRSDDQVSFADGYPILIASRESLDDLNTRLQTPIPMNRFRPNLVVAGCRPFEEDTWKRIRIGEVEIGLVKPCSRCEVTTIDQAAAVRGKEPLTTLARFRRLEGSKVMFAMNAIPLNEGRLRVGEPVEILA